MRSRSPSPAPVASGSAWFAGGLSGPVRCFALGTIVACSAGTGAAGALGCPATPGSALVDECPAEPQPGAATPAAAPPPDAAEPSRSVEPGGVVHGGRASTFELRATAGEAARVLRVTVGEVHNPENANLVLAIAALLPAQQPELGRLSFYPSNQGGVFVLPLPASVAEHVASNHALTLRCTLEADAGGLEAAQVRLRALTLGAEP